MDGPEMTKKWLQVHNPQLTWSHTQRHTQTSLLSLKHESLRLPYGGISRRYLRHSVCRRRLRHRPQTDSRSLTWFSCLKKPYRQHCIFDTFSKTTKKRGILNVLLKEKYMLIINQWLSTHTIRLTENTCMSATHLWPHTPQPHQKCIFNNWHLKAHKSSLLSITQHY